MPRSTLTRFACQAAAFVVFGLPLALCAARPRALRQRTARHSAPRRSRTPPSRPRSLAARAVPLSCARRCFWIAPGFRPARLTAARRQHAKSRGGIPERVRAPADRSNRCRTWRALQAGDAPVLTTYAVTHKDADGPFVRIPADIMERAGLKWLATKPPSKRSQKSFTPAPDCCVT